MSQKREMRVLWEQVRIERSERQKNQNDSRTTLGFTQQERTQKIQRTCQRRTPGKRASPKAEVPLSASMDSASPLVRHCAIKPDIGCQNKDLMEICLRTIPSLLSEIHQYGHLCWCSRNCSWFRRYSHRSVDLRMWCESVWFLKRPIQVSTTP